MTLYIPMNKNKIAPLNAPLSSITPTAYQSFPKMTEEAPRAPDVPLCPHGKLDWSCLQCGGTGQCKHGKAYCDECGWAGSKCPHDRERRFCKECKANGIPVTGICEHNIHKFYCKRCPGRGICEHGLRRLACATCRTIPLQPLTTLPGRSTVPRRS